MGLVVLAQRGKLVLEGGARGKHLHADEMGQAPVHGVGGDGGGVQAVRVTHRGEDGDLGEPPEQHHVGPLLPAQDLSSLRHEPSKGPGGPLRLRRQGLGLQRGHPYPLRVRLANLFGQPLASQRQHEPVVSHWIDVNLHPGDAKGVQTTAEGSRLRGGDAPRPPVHQDVRRVHGAEVAPSGHVARLDVHPNAKGLQHAPAHLVLQRVVAKEGQMPRPAPGGDAGQHRRGQATGALLGQPVQVGEMGRLQLGLSRLRVGQAP